MKAETAEKDDKAHFFKVTDVKADIKNFDIKLKKSKHKILFAIGKPILKRALRPAIRTALESGIKQKATELDGLMYQIHTEAEKAKQDAKRNPDPENVKNIYQYYAEAVQRQMTQRKEQAQRKKEEKTANTKFNMAMTKQDAIFKDIDLPSGISTKATEYKELAQKGERWESPVFSVGSAKETSTHVSVPEIKRKSQVKSTHGTQGTQGTHGTNGTNGVTNGHTKGFEKQVDGAFNPQTV